MQENKKPVFIVATANNVESLPPELLRKGRFSEIWGAIEPNKEEREEIWKIHIKKVRPTRVEDFDYKAMVEASKMFTGAEIEGVVEEAMFDAFHDNRREMTTEDIIKACGAIVPQATACKQRVDAIREWMKSKARFVSSSTDTTNSTQSTWNKMREVR
jgi:SpoVK/Ycf46/Vps4 family AAA+-type ATPase